MWIYSCVDSLVALKLMVGSLCETKEPLQFRSSRSSLRSPSKLEESRVVSAPSGVLRRASTHPSLNSTTAIDKALELPPLPIDSSFPNISVKSSIESLLSDAITDVDSALELPPLPIDSSFPNISVKSSIESLLSDAITDVESVPCFEASSLPENLSKHFKGCRRQNLNRKTLSKGNSSSDSELSDEYVYVGTASTTNLTIGANLTKDIVVNSTPLRVQEGFYNLNSSSNHCVTSTHVCSQLKQTATKTKLNLSNSRRKSLFSDPAPFKTYPKFALTIYEVSIEWVFFEGHDFPRLTSSKTNNATKTVSHLKDLSRAEPDSTRNYLISSCSRQFDKTLVVRLTNIYFRKAKFYQSISQCSEKSTSVSNESSFDLPVNRRFSVNSIIGTSSLPNQNANLITRYAIRIKSVRILDRISKSRVNHLLHARLVDSTGLRYEPSTDILRASFLIQHASPTLGCLPRTYSTYPKPCQRLPGSEQKPRNDLEGEGKISLQPLQVNLDQYTLTFLRDYHEALLSTLELCLEEIASQTSVLMFLPTLDNQSTDDDESTQAFPPNTSFSKETRQCEDIDDDIIFIRKFIFSSDLPIRFNYHGRQLDLRQGTMCGLLALCLQLNNAELILPRHVYQRGYRGWSNLLEDILADFTLALRSQLPRVLLRSIGPMREVTNILHGFWNLIYQSLKGLQNYPSDYIQAGCGSRDAYLCTRCRRIIKSGFGKRCTCQLVGLPISMASPEQLIYGLRSGTRAFSTSAMWSTLELSAQTIRAVQSLLETAYDIFTPGPSIRHRQQRLRQPADLREGLNNAVEAVTRGVNLIAGDLCGVVVNPANSPESNKGSVGLFGDVLRQIPPAMVTPLVFGCEATANILGGLRNQLRPDAKLEDEEKWKDTHGL